jgi:hypothetical protein
VIQSYQLNNPEIERVIDLVRDFGKTNLKKKVEDSLNIPAPGSRAGSGWYVGEDAVVPGTARVPTTYQTNVKEGYTGWYRNR